MATDGSDLIALGEVWQALDGMVAGEDVEINVEISVGFRRGDAAFEQGSFACLSIDWERVQLDVLQTEWSAGIGSDHQTEVFATMTSDGRYDAHRIDEWIDQLRQHRASDRARLRTDRNHV